MQSKWAVQWTMDIQPKSGSGLGTLPGYSFIHILFEDLLHTSAPISKTSFEDRGMLHQDYQPVDQKSVKMLGS